MRILLLSMLILAMLAGGAALGISLIMRNKYAEINALEIRHVDAAEVPDGTYPGSYTYAGFTYEVEVDVYSSRITDIRVVTNRDKKHALMAEGVIQRVLTQQTPEVDTITGATRTSKAFLKAIENALNQANR